MRDIRIYINAIEGEIRGQYYEQQDRLFGLRWDAKIKDDYAVVKALIALKALFSLLFTSRALGIRCDAAEVCINTCALRGRCTLKNSGNVAAVKEDFQIV